MLKEPRHQSTACRRPRLASRRGAASLEFVLVVPVLTTLLLAIVDVGRAAAQLITSYEALRDVAAYGVYYPPPDVTRPGTWLTSKLPTGASLVGVYCGALNGTAVCTAANASQTPKFFQLRQPVTVEAILLRFMAGTYDVTYATRFQ